MWEHNLFIIIATVPLLSWVLFQYESEIYWEGIEFWLLYKIIYFEFCKLQKWLIERYLIFRLSFSIATLRTRSDPISTNRVLVNQVQVADNTLIHNRVWGQEWGGIHVAMLECTVVSRLHCFFDWKKFIAEIWSWIWILKFNVELEVQREIWNSLRT